MISRCRSSLFLFVGIGDQFCCWRLSFEVCMLFLVVCFRMYAGREIKRLFAFINIHVIDSRTNFVTTRYAR